MKDNYIMKKSTRVRISAVLPGEKGEPPCSQDRTKALHTDYTAPHTYSGETTQQVTAPIPPVRSVVIIVNLEDLQAHFTETVFQDSFPPHTAPFFEQA